MGEYDATDPYLGIRDGFLALAIVTSANVFSFLTVVDREPSGITGSRGSGSNSVRAGTQEFACEVGDPSQGVYVVPDDACLPLSPTLESYFFIFPIIVLCLIGYALTNRSNGQENLMGMIRSPWWSFLLFSSLYIIFGFVDLWLLDSVGIDRAVGGAIAPNITYVLILGFHTISVAAPFGIYTLPLLPTWTKNTFGQEARDSLRLFIDANWRRARILTTLALTGAVGTTLPFVFSQISPNLFFVLAIVGSVTVGPLGIVWFLMRRIREAEKELHPT